jgi:preprotein translocase YajC subunit
MMQSAYTLFAQDAPPAAPAKQPDMPFFMNPLFLFAMLGLFFFVVYLPGIRRQKREQEELLKNIKAGSRVVLSSGIVARVVKDHEDGELTVSSDDTRLRVLKSSVVTVQGEEAAAAAK